MNKLIVCVCISSIFFSCDIRNTRNKADAMASNTTAQFTDSTTVQLIDSAYNFGNVTDGDKVEYSYRFRNTGKNPLIVSSAVASCGCTVPDLGRGRPGARTYARLTAGLYQALSEGIATFLPMPSGRATDLWAFANTSMRARISGGNGAVLRAVMSI